MAKSAWARFATYISFHGGLFLGPMGENSGFVSMFKLLLSEEECELGMHIPNKPTSVEKNSSFSQGSGGKSGSFAQAYEPKRRLL